MRTTLFGELPLRRVLSLSLSEPELYVVTVPSEMSHLLNSIAHRSKVPGDVQITAADESGPYEVCLTPAVFASWALALDVDYGRAPTRH